jgi:hypothetical protein
MPRAPSVVLAVVLAVVSAVVLAGVVLIAPRAHAGGSDTSSIACGSSQSGWSAPNGALVVNHGSGIISAVLRALGESRTHSMLSHGPGGWVTHSTMFDPGTNGWPTYCDTPVRASEMRHGYPGASQVQQGGIYTFLFGHGSPHYVGYVIAPSGSKRTAAAGVADYAWFQMPYAGVTSLRDGNQGFYLLGETEKRACAYSWWDSYYQNNCPAQWLGTNDGCDCGCQVEDADCVANAGFHRIEYSFFNYLNSQGRPFSEWTTEHGSQCSSIVAQLYRLDAGDYIAPASYSHNQVVAAGNALYSAVYNECKTGLGDWGNIGAAVTCAFPYFDLDICDDAARQVRNCFINPGYCNSSSSSPWSNLVNSSQGAYSISPDRLVGASGHFPPGSAHAGPWAGSAEVAVQWNSGGNVYGCWY